MKRIFFQFIKFGLVGTINTVVSYLIYIFLVILHFHYIFSTIIGYIGSLAVGYFLNRVWVFKAYTVNINKSIFKFCITYGSSLLLNLCCMYTWVNILKISQIVAPFISLFITIPFNFILNKCWTFKASI